MVTVRDDKGWAGLDGASRDYTPRFNYLGLSTDQKPTGGVGINSIFLELDTGDAYYFDGTDWQEVG